MPKISIALPDLRGGGAERVCLDLAYEFSRRGHIVEFVLMRMEGEFLSEARSSFSIVDLNAFRSRYVPRALAYYLRRNQPDVLIANMWSLTAASVCARFLSGRRPKLLLVEHNVLSKQYASWGMFHTCIMRLSMSLTYRWSDAVAAVSQGAAHDVERLAVLPHGDVSVVYNPIRSKGPPSAGAIALAQSLWGLDETERILSVGSLKDQKNHALLIRAFAVMPRPNARLMILGHGQNEEELRSLADQLQVADRVIFAGFHSDPTAFYHTANLFVLSSDYEGFGNVIVEALSCGLSVVSTDCPSGPAEILEYGRYGRLVPVGDANAVAKAMDEALASPSDPEMLKRRAADFAPDIAAQRYLDLLELS